jgi:hypothetical protein
MSADGWYQTNALQMFLQSAELRLIGIDARPELELSCGLITVARGSCVLRLHPVDLVRQGAIGTIDIPLDRPVMRGEVHLPRAGFDRITTLIGPSPPRPLAVVLALRESLEINLQGDLRIDRNLSLTVSDFSLNVPLC